MPTTPDLPKQLPDPFDALRAGVDAHRAVTDAAKQTGAAVQQAKLEQPAEAVSAS